MEVPGSLPQRVFLLAYDPEKGRFRVGTNLGAMVRAAALADLYLDGRLTDENGRPAAADRRPGIDLVLATVLEEVASSRPRKWQSWIGRGQRATVSAVREQLSAGGWIRVEPRRILGLFPTTRVTLRDPRVRKNLLGRVSGALRDPVGRVDLADAALVAIVAAGELGVVLSRRARRDAKRRIQELTDLSGPVGPALRKQIAAEAAAAAGG
ncbi:GPP34 family phosphoprotein [Actinoplanes sp. NPDC051861]|uniref:GOLPH3/VPS74 family protein n=1 Tax=Actinoplanes sp. NPDC051861 TaxID=3155170 RepID=UPI0034212366